MMTSHRRSSASWAMLVSVGVAVFVVYLLGQRGSAVEGWPGGSAMYECCCHESSGCRKSCFMCRNVDFVCNCGSCSCYMDSGLQDVEDGLSRNDYNHIRSRSNRGLQDNRPDFTDKDEDKDLISVLNDEDKDKDKDKKHHCCLVDLLSMLMRSGGGKKSRSDWRYGPYGPGR